MIVKYPIIELFFKQDTFTEEDLNNLRKQVDTHAPNTEQRKAMMSSIDLHLVAYSMGVSLQHTVKEKNRYPKVNNVIKKKTTLSKKQRIIKTVNKKNKKKTNKYDEAKSLTSRLKKALNAHRTLKGLRKSVATTNPNKTKSNIISSKAQSKNKQKINLKTQAPVDKKTIEITEMLKKRGIDKSTAKGERFQTYRGSKNTYFKIIYTRM